MFESCTNVEYEYFENGNLKAEYSMDNGKLDGSYTSYYLNGQIFEKANFKNGLRDGGYVMYDSLGNVETTKQYIIRNNREELNQIIFYRNDSICGGSEYYDLFFKEDTIDINSSYNYTSIRKS